MKAPEAPTPGDAAPGSASAHSGERAKNEDSGVPPDDQADHACIGMLVGGKYRLERVLSQGGMGSLWVARNEALDVQVAIKLIRTDIEGWLTPLLADRLLQEARASAQLGHPAIVRTLDFGKTDYGDPYIVMELLVGEDLATALERRGRVSPKKAIRVMLPIVHALAAVHDKDIVHRDVKPENIFLAASDRGAVQPKLIDFGVAKLERKRSKRITAAGALLGSPAYMSPEQARGDEADYPADIWAVCVVLYEMVTGRLPFEGKNYTAVLRSVIEDVAPSITVFSAGDEDLWEVIECGLQKDPDRRWRSMRELGVALARWAANRDVKDDIAGGSLEAVWFSSDSATLRDDALQSVPPGPMPHDSARAERFQRVDTTPIAPVFQARGWSSRPGKSQPPPDSVDPRRSDPFLGDSGRLSAPYLLESEPAPHSDPRDSASSWRAPTSERPQLRSNPAISDRAPMPLPAPRSLQPSVPSYPAPLSGDPQQAHYEGMLIAARISDSRFRMVVIAVTLVVLILGGLTVWRLTAPERRPPAPEPAGASV